MNATEFESEKWRKLFHEHGGFVSSSTVSEWRNGKRNMRSYNKQIFIDILCEDKMIEHEEKIRKEIITFLKIGQMHEVYWQLEKMDYRNFLEYILSKEALDGLIDLSYNWDRVPEEQLVKMCVSKAEKLHDNLQFRINEDNNRLMIKYVHQGIHNYTVIARIMLGDKSAENIEEECLFLSEKYGVDCLKYIFVSADVTDEIYNDMLIKYDAYILKIDFYDVNNVEILENYIFKHNINLDNNTKYFMNALAEVIIHKICDMNLIVLKQILCEKFDYGKVSESFFKDNAGVWMYNYPVRRALAFEEKLIKQKFRAAAKQGKSKLNILDISISGGLLGMRCSFGAGKVTCVDISFQGIMAQKRIVDKYNEVKSSVNDGIENIEFSLMRIDTMKILEDLIPENGYDLIIIGLGAGSYIRDLDAFLRQVGGWLKCGKKDADEGLILLSVFNKEALCFNSSHAKMDFKYNYGNFRHIGDEWSLAAMLYTYKEISRMALKYYELIERYSYPTVLSVISDNYNKEILDKLKEIDKYYAKGDKDTANRGLFHTLMLKKPYLDKVPQCYLDIKKFLSENDMVVKTIEHEEITSKAHMVRELNKHNILAGDNFIKTIVLYDEKNNFLIYFLLPLNKKLKKDCLKSWYKQKEIEFTMTRLRFCVESELKNMGLMTGSLSPFSYSVIETSENKYILCDKEVDNSAFETLYTYSSNLEVTFEISKDGFMSYLKSNNAEFV